MPDIVSPFDRPLTHEFIFNIVYFPVNIFRDTTGSDVAHGERLDRRALELEREMAKMEHREMEEEGTLVLGLEVRFFCFFF